MDTGGPEQAIAADEGPSELEIELMRAGEAAETDATSEDDETPGAREFDRAVTAADSHP